MEAELSGNKPTQQQTHTLTLTDEELCSLCWLWKASITMSEFAKEIYPALRAIDSRYAGRCYDISAEFGYTQKQTREILERESRHIQDTPSLSRNWRTVLPQLRA
nr:P22AR C-terminal domain-containing protein [Limnobaculum xujianqingii]